MALLTSLLTLLLIPLHFAPPAPVSLGPHRHHHRFVVVFPGHSGPSFIGSAPPDRPSRRRIGYPHHLHSVVAIITSPGWTLQSSPPKIDPTVIWAGILASISLSDRSSWSACPGARAPIETLQPSIDFIKTIYPNLQYLITVCTGASLAARAGVLDRRRATTNKRAWTFVTAFGPDVEWVSPARFVVDGNIWSSSGVSALLFFLSPSSLGLMDFKTNPHSTADDGTKTNQVTAGLDLIWAWIEEVYGADLAYEISGMTEYEPHPPTYDPFAERFNVPPSP
ncbi:hypothetical protein jhhlp_004320 [Lomentospora prolificans]|uniref:DJ-1/PfpI domain-containing protein n=1 Tax=Lomentospora prolificans TaxID=41688 RepID=A0A2N3NB89_9PEZI|nr:hypothetical protein jhhlp_004320 [Lomentospora prolificans]